MLPSAPTHSLHGRIPSDLHYRVLLYLCVCVFVSVVEREREKMVMLHSDPTHSLWKLQKKSVFF